MPPRSSAPIRGTRLLQGCRADSSAACAASSTPSGVSSPPAADREPAWTQTWPAFERKRGQGRPAPDRAESLPLSRYAEGLPAGFALPLAVPPCSVNAHLMHCNAAYCIVNAYCVSGLARGLESPANRPLRRGSGSGMTLPTPHFPLPTPYFPLPTSYFPLPTSYVLLPTSYFLRPSQSDIFCHRANSG